MDDSGIDRLLGRAKDIPHKGWIVGIVLPLLLSGTCWAGSAFNVHTPRGELHWHGAEAEETK